MNDQRAKADAGKLHLSYVPPAGITAIARVREYGVEKYHDPENWRKVEFDRYYEAFLRHVLAMWNDPYSVDFESGLPHLWHALTNGAFMAQMMEDEHEKNA